MSFSSCLAVMGGSFFKLGYDGAGQRRINAGRLQPVRYPPYTLALAMALP